MAGRSRKKKTQEPEILNRKARHEYHIERTLEVGMILIGSEVKSVRAGQASLAEGYVRAEESPLRLTLIGAHIAEYPPATAHNHKPTRPRRLLAHKREMEKLVMESAGKGVTLVPLKMYFKDGRIKLQVAVARGKRRSDKREDLRKREDERDIQRAMSRRM